MLRAERLVTGNAETIALLHGLTGHPLALLDLFPTLAPAFNAPLIFLLYPSAISLVSSFQLLRTEEFYGYCHFNRS